jgi:hypothetical protein
LPNAPEMNGVSVFLSSTSLDLQPEREAIEGVMRHMKRVRFVGMEYFGARDASARVASLAEVDGSDIYVGVLGSRYGSGITEAEYRRAQELRLPCLFYLRVLPEHMAAPSEDAKRLAAFREEVRAHHIVVEFRTAEELQARVAADLHNLILDRLLVQGIGKLQADYDTRIRRFVAEYLGDAQHPIAFGGRDYELKILDRWLDDDRAPPYALLAGSAGRGKSALLVRWVQCVIAKDDLDVIFFPISIRFRTNLAGVTFASIAARLATLHGEGVPGAADTPAEVWRELVSSYLDRPLPPGRRFLLVIDGADESAEASIGPDLFPREPPAGLKILVSARLLAGDADAKGWLGRLGWSSPDRAHPLELDPLTPDGLVQVLRNMSIPLEVLSGRSDVVAELFRLSAGDPLLVNLYAADLWTRGEEVARLQPSDLAQIEPGLEGYFERWRQDQRELWGAKSPQREPAYNDVFNVLACALGPLLTSQLLELLPPERPLDVWALEDVLEDLKRFVIGDGDEQGYAFSHPRLGDYFYELLQAAGRTEVHEARFVSWGLRCTQALETQGVAYQVPVYVLQFLRRHMDRARCDAKAFQVLSSTLWARAWERLDRGSYTGFLADLSVVQQIVSTESGKLAAAGAVSPFTATELRCALCYSSIVTLAGDVSVPALIAIVSKEIWSAAQALAYATNIPQRRSRLATIFELATVVDEAYVPLALAAAVTETRSLCGSEDGREVVKNFVEELGYGIDAMKSASQLARKIDAVNRVARQLPAPDNHWLMGLLEMPNVPRAAGAVSEWELRIDAALNVLSAVATTSAGHRGRAMELALRLLRYLEPSRWPEAAERMGHLVSAPMVAPLAEAAERLPFRIRVRVLVELARRAAAESTPAIRDALAKAFADIRAAPGEHLDALRRAAHWLSPRDLLQHVDHAADALPDAERVALYDEIASGRADPDVVTELGLRALDVLEAPLQREDAVSALAALVDWLLPAGLGDSLEPWRREVYSAGLYRRLRRLLSASAVSRNRGRVVAFAIERSLGRVLMDERGMLAASVKRAVYELHQIEADEEPPPPDPTAAIVTPDAVNRSEFATSVLARYDGGKQPAEVLAEIVRSLQPAPDFPELLQFFAELCSWLTPLHVRSALGFVLEQADFDSLVAALEPILPLIAAGPLAPANAETLEVVHSLADIASRHDAADAVAMFLRVSVPDDVRLELLSAALSKLQQEDQRRLRLTVVSEIGRLTGDSVPVLLAILGRWKDQAADHVPDSLVEAICRLNPSTWLSVARRLPVHTRRAALTRLPDYQPLHAEGVWAGLTGAIQALRSDRDKAMWLIDIVSCGVSAPPSSLLAAASSIVDDDQRLLALAAVVLRLPLPDRPAVVVDALKLSRRRGTNPLITRGLIQCAVDLGTGPDLTREAIETATTLTDRALRSSAFAELAPSLQAATLGEALSAFRRIDDVAGRVRAMNALTLAVTEPALQQSAAARVRDSIGALAPGARSAAAAIYIAALLRPPARWQVLEDGLTQPGEEATGFTLEELVESLPAALQEAPAKLFALALTWLRKVPASSARARALAQLMAFMPEGLLPVAFVRLAESAAFLFSRAGCESLDRAFWFFPAKIVRLLGQQRGRLSSDANRLLSELELRQANAMQPPLLPPPDLSQIKQRRSLFGSCDPDSILQLRAALAYGPPSEAMPDFVHAVASISDAELRQATVPYLGAHRTRHQLEQAISLTTKIESPADRCMLRLRLSSSLSGVERERLLDDALTSASEEKLGFARAFAAAEVAATEPARLSPALDVLYAGGDVSAKAGALSELIPRLGDEAAATAISTLHRLDDWWVEARLLSTLASRLGPRAAAAGFECASSLTSGVARARVAAVLVPHLPDDLRHRVEKLLDGIEVDYAWLELLAATVERWPSALTETPACVAAARISALSGDDFITDWLVRMTLHWPTAAWPEFFSAVGHIGVSSARAEVLNELLRRREPAAIPDAIAAAMDAISDDFFRSVAFGHLAIRFGDEVLLRETMECASQRGGATARIEALATMADLAESIPDALLDELLAYWLCDTRRLTTALLAIGRLMTPRQALRVLEMLRNPPASLTPEHLDELLFTLAQRLAEADVRHVIAVAARHCSERRLTGLLVDLAVILDSEASAPAALELASRMTSPTYRADVLCGVFSRLNSADRERALASLRSIEDRAERERRLVSVRDTALDAIQGVRSDGARASHDSVTSQAAGATSADETDPILQSLLDEAMARNSESSPAPARRFRIKGESSSKCATLLSELQSLECEADRYLAINKRLPSLAQSELEALIVELPRHVTEVHQAELLGRIVERVRGSQRRQLLGVALSLVDPAAKRRALQLVIPHVAGALKPELHDHWRDFLKQARRTDRDQLFSTLETMAPVLAALGGDVGVIEAIEAIDEIGRSWP